MTLQTVNFGSASDGSQGDTARAAFGRINQNFSDTTNAASRLVGTAAGQLMEVGAFGLGATSLAILSSIDQQSIPPGWYRITSATGGSLPTATGIARIDSHAPGSSSDNWAFQTIFGTNGRIYCRYSINLGAWSQWREQYGFGSSPAFSGYMTISRTDAFDTGIDLQGPAGKPRYVIFRTGSNPRFYFGADGSAEGGSNAGSNFFIDRYNDAGAYLGKPLQINRSTGQTILESLSVTGPVRVGQYTLASLPSASAFTGHEIDVTDAAGGAKRCRSDGTNWKILNTTTTVS